MVVVPALYVLASIALVVAFGIPYQRDIVAVWMLLGLLCFSVSDLRGYFRGLVLELLPFLGILIAYDSLRGDAGTLFTVHYLPQLEVDKWLFGGTAPSETLQHWLWHGHVTWYLVAMLAVYLSHFFATPVLAAVLWKTDRQRFRSFAVFVVTLSSLGMLTYALYPAAPPWLAGQAGFMPHVVRLVPAVFTDLHLRSAGSLIEHGYRYANDVAAVPSLHAAFALLIAVTLWPRKRKWLRPVVALYPLAMGFALVLAAEHYVSDVLLGWLYTVAAVLVGRAVIRWWSGRAARLKSEPVLAPEPAYAAER